MLTLLTPPENSTDLKEKADWVKTLPDLAYTAENFCSNFLFPINISQMSARSEEGKTVPVYRGRSETPKAVDWANVWLSDDPESCLHILLHLDHWWPASKSYVVAIIYILQASWPTLRAEVSLLHSFKRWRSRSRCFVVAYKPSDATQRQTEGMPCFLFKSAL